MLNVRQTNLTALHLTNQNLILICEEEAFHLHSTDGKNINSHKVSELKSPQEKAETKALQKGYKNVHIRTPDSDIFFICLYYAKTELQGLNVFIHKAKMMTLNLPLSQIGSSFSVSTDLKVELEEFVCLYYSRKHYNETNELRFSVLQEKCGGDKIEIKSAFIPSCRDVIKQHIRRANCQV